MPYLYVTLLSVKDSKQETFSVFDIHFPSFLSVCRFVADKNHFALLHVPAAIFSTISILDTSFIYQTRRNYSGMSVTILTGYFIENWFTKYKACIVAVVAVVDLASHRRCNYPDDRSDRISMKQHPLINL